MISWGLWGLKLLFVGFAAYYGGLAIGEIFNNVDIGVNAMFAIGSILLWKTLDPDKFPNV